MANAQGAAPSYEEAKARFCARGGASNGPAIIFGRVLDADTDAPLGGVNLSLVYTDSSASLRTERVRRTRSLDDGSFAICGIADRYAGTIQATRGAVSTPELPVAANNELLSTIMLSLNLSGTNKSVLRGHVTVKRGPGVAGAQVAVQGATSIAVTGADGAFTLSDLPSGTQAVVVRKIGFAPATVSVQLSSRKPADVSVVMSEAQMLAAVKVVGKLDDALHAVGFDSRRHSSSGHFITPEDIERRNPMMFTDLLQTIPGFRVTNVGMGRMLQSTRTASGTTDGCVNIFVDRAPFAQMTPGDLDDAFRPADIGAIEAYPSATDAPAEFHVNGHACATIVMWTKTRLAKKGG